MYLWYLAAFVVLILIEISTYNLITVWLAVSALLTSVYAYFFPTQIVPQVFIFLILSVILIALTKPLVKKFKKTTEKTNADRLIGMEAVVLEEINQMEGKGQVKVAGQIWSAKSKSGDILEVGKTVTVQSIEGVKVVVE